MPPPEEIRDPKTIADLTAIADVEMCGEFAPGSAKGG
jgi:hypothetical protein